MIEHGLPVLIEINSVNIIIVNFAGIHRFIA